MNPGRLDSRLKGGSENCVQYKLAELVLQNAIILLAKHSSGFPMASKLPLSCVLHRHILLHSLNLGLISENGSSIYPDIYIGNLRIILDTSLLLQLPPHVHTQHTTLKFSGLKQYAFKLRESEDW